MRFSSAAVVLALVVAASMAGCIGESPEQQARADLPQGEDDDGDEEHRPGQPCLVCHGESYHPGEKVFVLAGTIFERASDADNRGLEGAAVNFIDSVGHEFTALTNRAGNFMVQVDASLASPNQRKKGKLSIPWDPVFPLTVAVTHNGVDKSMDSQIWREGSCAGCHYSPQPGTDHVEKVWLSEGAL